MLRQASAAIRQTLERGFAAEELTLPQFNILTMLHAYPGITGADLARLTLLTPQTVNVITSNLLKAGAISREPSAKDRRTITLSLTSAGLAKLTACRVIADMVEVKMLAGLTSADTTAVRKWLAAMAKLEGGE